MSNFWVKGQDGTARDPAVSSGSEITVYEDDRAYIWESNDDSSVANVYTHNMFGGNLNFTVDVSDMEASCAGGLALVNLDDTTCTESDVENGNCTPTEVFSANKYGFAYGVGSCTFGTEQFGSSVKRYGPTSEHWINSEFPYEVEMVFNADDNYTTMP